jgi:hypothetical protein
VLFSSVVKSALTSVIASLLACVSSDIALSRRETLALVLFSRLLILALTLLIASVLACVSVAIALSTRAISPLVFESIALISAVMVSSDSAVDFFSSAVAIARDHSVMLEFTSSKDADIWTNFSALDASLTVSCL